MGSQDTLKDAKARLMDAGATLFAEKGFKGASIREICEQAGTGNNMVHHYFGSKQGLFDALIDQFSVEVFMVPIRIMEKKPDTRAQFVSRFELFVEETLEAMIVNRRLLTMIMNSGFLPDANPFSDYFLSFVSFIEHGKNNGFVNQGIDAAMLTGLVLDRLSNQIIFAELIVASSGEDIINDAAHRQRWLSANLYLFLHGFLEG